MIEINLNYKKIGDGEPVIILHGFLGMLDNWKTFGRQLAESYSVFLIDQRNHGKSPWTSDFSYKLLADDLLHFIDTHELEKVNIIGHSMGGKAAMKFGLTYPDRLAKMVVVDIAPKVYPPKHQTILNALNAVDPTNFKNRTEADTALAEHIGDWGIRQFLLKNVTRSKEGGFRWKMNLEALTNAYGEISSSDIKGTFEQPVLFVNGGNSSYVEEGDQPMILEHFPAAQFETIEDSGHWVHAEKGDELLGIIKKFLGV